MTLQKVVCVTFTGSELDETLWASLDLLTEKRVITPDFETAIAEHSDADALLVKLGAKVSSETMSHFPNLKYMGMFGTGYGGIDVAYAKTKGITVTNIADYATEGVAEFTVGILLEHLRSIATAKTQAAQENYSDDGFKGTEIRGKKWGVIGLGNIGQRTAELAQAFGATVSYWSRSRKPEVEAKGIVFTELDNLLQESDIITLNLALNSETEYIINENRVALIKQNAIFVNPSPMELIDFEALKNRLTKNDFVFMLDHSDEMTAEQLTSLKPFNNCVMYPPIAYLTIEAGNLKRGIYLKNIENFLKGSPSNKVS